MTKNNIVRAMKKAEEALNDAIEHYNEAADAVETKRVALEDLLTVARDEHNLDLEDPDFEAPPQLDPVELDLEE
jgi:hypothetical protein